MQRKKLVIGLFGFGCVGSGLYKVLGKEAVTGQVATIKKIVAKNPLKKRDIAPHQLSYCKDDILDDDEINVVVELTDDADAAFQIVQAAMQKGKAVVSANKKMVSTYFMELYHLQQEYRVPFLYEAACCASLPLIRNLEEYYDTDTLQSVEGILNGSTNYILTKTFNEKIQFADALKTAQALGYAESDPSLDISGKDAAYKLSILLIHAFGIHVQQEDIFTVGIQQINEVDNAYALARNQKIKLVARAFKQLDGCVRFFVMPAFVQHDHYLYHVDDVFNGVITRTHLADTHFYAGRGAGALPTSSAVLSDIAALGYQYKYEYKKLVSAGPKNISHDCLLQVYVSFPIAKADFVKNYFTEIGEAFSNSEKGYFTGTITLKNLQALQQKDEALSFILMDVCIAEEEQKHEAAWQEEAVLEFE